MYEQYDQTEPELDNSKNWDNLSDSKCPLCGLGLFPAVGYQKCTCGFKIHTDRFEQMRTEQQNRRLNPELRKKLAEGKKVKFKPVQTFKEDKPKFNINDLFNY